MKHFSGFPSKMEYTPLPNFFFSGLLPHMNDMAELKTTLHIFQVLYRKRGHPRFVSFRELLRNASLIGGIKDTVRPPEEVLRTALRAATERGILLHVLLEQNGETEDVYLINTEPNRQVLARIESGEIQLNGLKIEHEIDTAPEEQPDIFALYEENIGMLTPMIAEELRQAETLYPPGWIRDATREAVAANKRNWRYIARILERWSVEGRTDGTHRRHSSQKTDPDKYFRGKYGHVVQR